jgi:hypothetical protein
MQGKLLGFMVTVSVFAIFSGGAEAQHVLKRNARHACRQLVTVTHPEMKGDARKAEIANCNADEDAYNKQAGF